MDTLIELWEKPEAEEIYMIAGWRQWADAGSISSELPAYLINKTSARKIGRIKPDGFYLFQIPGTHHLLRPEIKLEDGYRQEIEHRKNEIYYTGDEKKGLVIFMGDEPHMNEERYAEAFFDLTDALNVKRVAAVGGVYGPMPYEKDREISCAYSLRSMKQDLSNYAVKLSNYEGGSTIGTYLVDRAEHRETEFFVFYAFVPSYDFGQISLSQQPGIRIETDFKAWYDLMRRINHMFDLGVDLTELQQESADLIESMTEKVEELEKEIPQLNVKEYIDKLGKEFVEMTFMPLDDVWERELGDLFDDE